MTGGGGAERRRSPGKNPRQRRLRKRRSADDGAPPSSSSSNAAAAVAAVKSPPRRRSAPAFVRIAVAIAGAVLRLAPIAAISAPFWILTLSLAPIFGRPPILVRLSQTLRYLRFAVAGAEADDDTDAPVVVVVVAGCWDRRIELAEIVLSHTLLSPVHSSAWILDEILYGRRLSDLEPHEEDALDRSLFVVSAYRSASTRMARCLATEARFANDNDGGDGDGVPCFVAPNAMMCAYPYLWLWKLTRWVVGDIPDEPDPSLGDGGGDEGITKRDVRERFNAGFTPESLARHPNDPFQVDTFDGSFLSFHLNGLSWRFCGGGILPPAAIAREFSYAEQTDALNRTIWRTDMVEHIDRLARKTLVFSAAAPPPPAAGGAERHRRRQRFLLKGHFLSICPDLLLRRTRGDEARFLTVLRDPCDRLRSGINHTAVNPTILHHPPRSDDEEEEEDGPIPWSALAAVLEETEARYCERELEWFGGNDDDDEPGDGDDHDDDRTRRRQKLAVTFDSFVSDKDRTVDAIVDWLGLREDGPVVVTPTAATTTTTTKSAAAGKTRKKRKNKKGLGPRPTGGDGDGDHPAATAPPGRYRVDRSLSELGIDEVAYRKRLSGYLSWMKRVEREGGSHRGRDRREDEPE